jgi:hypothetical protein
MDSPWLDSMLPPCDELWVAETMTLPPLCPQTIRAKHIRLLRGAPQALGVSLFIRDPMALRIQVGGAHFGHDLQRGWCQTRMVPKMLGFCLSA